ncbi:MAG: MipA/OmpV family protein [Acetobacteraceae bacterium]
MEKLFAPKMPKWQFELGIATSFQPLYDGAQRYRVMGGPVIDIRYRDLLFASTGEGIGVNILLGRNWRVGVALTYDLGRRAADYASHLHGLGNISPAPEAKLFGEYVISQQFPLVLRADIRRNLGGSDGWIGDLGAYLPLPGSSKEFFWFAGPTMTFADATYMNRWFAINRAQAVLSGYPTYKADAGLKSFGFGITGVWFFRKHWFVNADVAIEQLVGSAARSPITESATNGVIDLSVNYQF